MHRRRPPTAGDTDPGQRWKPLRDDGRWRDAWLRNYRITTTGTLTTLHNLDMSKGDGAYPAGLVQHTNGIFYGPTTRGGRIVYHFCPAWCGALFSLSVP